MDLGILGLNANAGLIRADLGCGRINGTWGKRMAACSGISRGLKVRENIKCCHGIGDFKTGCASSPLTSGIGPEYVNNIPHDIDEPKVREQLIDPNKVVSVILGAGPGTHLFPLTDTRATPAVPIGGSYKLIDIPLSNCINSGINKIFVMTQFNSTCLNQHIFRTYSTRDIVKFSGGFVEVLAATRSPGMNWFQGTADAVRQFTWLFKDNMRKDIDHILILSGDQLYRMDYTDFLQQHIDTGADITISCAPVDGSRASEYGLVEIDKEGRIIQFREKPSGFELESMKYSSNAFLGLSPHDTKKYPYVASMGIYAFNQKTFLPLLRWVYSEANDFGADILPSAVKKFNVQVRVHSSDTTRVAEECHLGFGYWEEIGTIKSFYDANLALTKQPSKFQLYTKKPIYTWPLLLPPTKMEKCRISDSIISHGCILTDCSVDNSIIGVRSRIGYGAKLKSTLMMGANFYETEVEIASLLAKGKVPVGVGENTQIRNCIIDMNVRIGKNVVIANKDRVEEADRPNEGFYIRSGITIIKQNATIKDATVI